MANQQELNGIERIISRLAAASARVARFSYEQSAYDKVRGANNAGAPVTQDLTLADGIGHYDIEQEQNIPLADTAVTGSNKIDVNPSILDKGLRASGASISRGFENHFTGRVSFNLNMVVDMFVRLLSALKTFMSHNAAEYDSTAAYQIGDVAYLITTEGGQTLYQWFMRTGSPGVVGRPPTDGTEWKRLREYTSMPRPVNNVITTDLNDFVHHGSYSFVSNGSALVIQNMPPIPTEFSNTFILTVKSDLRSDNIIIQEVQFRDSGIEYTRTFDIENGAFVLKQNWYKTRDPNGLDIVGVPGLYAFRVQPNGHLYMYYDDPEPPELWIDYNVNSPTYGHLLWGHEEGIYQGPPVETGIVPLAHYNILMEHDGSGEPVVAEFVAVDSDGRVLCSTDGIRYFYGVISDNEWLGIAYGHGKFVAVGTNCLAHSADGVNFTTLLTAPARRLVAIAFGNGAFVAVSNDGTIMRSSDGVTFTDSAGPVSGWQDIAYGDGKFVIVGGDYDSGSSSGAIAVSTDNGVTFELVSSIADEFYAIAFGNGRFVCGGRRGRVYFSSDANTFQPSGLAGSAGFIYSAGYADGVFVIGGASNSILRSTDRGVTFTAVDAHIDDYVYGIAYANNVLTIMGYSGSRAVYSTDKAQTFMPITAVDLVPFGAVTAITSRYSQPPSRTLVSLTIGAHPDKETYEVGEAFDPTGLIVLGVYSNGDVEPVTGYTITGFDSSVEGDCTLTISYDGVSTTMIGVTVEVVIQPGERITVRASLRWHNLNSTTMTVSSSDIMLTVHDTLPSGYTLEDFTIVPTTGIPKWQIQVNLTEGVVAGTDIASTMGAHYFMNFRTEIINGFDSYPYNDAVEFVFMFSMANRRTLLFRRINVNNNMIRYTDISSENISTFDLPDEDVISLFPLVLQKT